MTHIRAQVHQNLVAFVKYLRTVPLLRYAGASMVIGSMSFAMLYILPLVNRDRLLLRAVYQVDVQGMSYEGDLRSQTEESHSRLLRLLANPGEESDTIELIDAIRKQDLEINLTNGRVILLSVSSGFWQQFATAWEQYTEVRDDQIALVLSGHAPLARTLERTKAEPAFRRVQTAIELARSEFQLDIATGLQQSTQQLNRAIEYLLAILVGTIASVLSLVWIDWNRVRIQGRLRSAKHQLLVSEDRFRQAFESAAVGMTIINLDFTILSLNQAAAQILAYDVAELIGQPIDIFMSPESSSEYRARLTGLNHEPGAVYQNELSVLCKDGRRVWVRNSVAVLPSAAGDHHFFSISEEITQEKEALERLVFLASSDPVTNLPNLYSFEQELASACHPDRTHLGALTLILVQADGFDFIKQAFGRTVAEEVLTEIGTRLAHIRNPNEFIARIDSDIFACLVQSNDFKFEATVRAEELRHAFREVSEQGKHQVPLAANIGIAFSNGTQPEPSTLLKFARAAMNEARSHGGDSIHIADPALEMRAAERHRIETALFKGLRSEELSTVFQPEFNIATGQLLRFEALSRWTSAELGLIPPESFIPIAELSGLISEIGNRVLVDSIRIAGAWVASGFQIGVSVNISPLQFMRPDFTESIRKLLSGSGFPPHLLELEITEGVFIRDLNHASSRILELQQLGVSVVLDDFGSGYSSLGYLRRMPIDAVKLDRSFLSAMHQGSVLDKASVSMLKSVLDIASALDLRVVIEGVETESQLDILRSLGCLEAQGFLLGRPESAELATQRVLRSPNALLNPSVA